MGYINTTTFGIVSRKNIHSVIILDSEVLVLKFPHGNAVKWACL